MRFSHATLMGSTLAAFCLVTADTLTEADEVSWLFDPDHILSYNLVMTEEDLAFLNADPMLEETVACNVTVNYLDPLTNTKSDSYESSTLIGAGCRYKGNQGSFGSCLDSSGAKKVDPTSCRTLSWKVDSNDFADQFGQESKQKFFGLKKLVFHGMQKDNSMLGERLAYTALNERLNNSPRIAPARVFVNDDYYGVYNFVEEVDDIFVDAHYTEANASLGAMWKEVWFPSAGHPNPLYDLDANEFEPDEVGDNDFTGLDRLSEVAQLAIECLTSNNCDEAAAQAILDGRVDSTSFLNAFLVNYLMLNWDSAQRFFVDTKNSSYPYYNHNFYLYVPQNGTIEYIPWDYSEALDVASCGFDAAYSTGTNDNENPQRGPPGGNSTTDGANSGTQSGIPGNGQENPMPMNDTESANGASTRPPTTGSSTTDDTSTQVRVEVLVGNTTEEAQGADAKGTSSGGPPTGGQGGPPGGQGGPGGVASASTCPETPHWFETDFDELLCTSASTVSGIGGDTNAIPFACDPVGKIMALAWKTQFLDMVAKATSEENFLGGINTHAKAYSTQIADDVERYANQGGIPSITDFRWGVVEALQKAGTESMYWFTYANNATSA